MRSTLTSWWMGCSIVVLGLAAAAPLGGCNGDPANGSSGSHEPTPEPKPEPEPEPEPKPLRLTLADVSVLVPLPASLDAPGHLAPTSAGARGELLPKGVYDEIPEFPVEPAQGLDYDAMRVVGIRFDGCHPRPDGCEAQIRLVMQPVSALGTSRDSALHLFYRLDDAELPELVRELRRLRELAPEVAAGPLDVHPALVAQGVGGVYGAALSEVVLRFAGEQNLVRMTFFLRAPPLQEVWFFGGFERIDGALEVMEIAGLGKSNQQVLRPEVEEGYDYDVNPLSSVPAVERPLLSTATAAAVSEEQRSAAFGAYLRLLNPRLVAPDDVSCAGCHVASYVLDQTKLTHGLDPADFADTFAIEGHDLGLRGGALQTPSSLRAFGWFKRDPMISQRVVNESAVVVDDLEQRFPPK
jgi:hypothetical protein